jgi:RimJ/RimL family protein N-acetyltransferase
MTFIPTLPIETERLSLRLFTDADVDAVLDIRSRPDVVRYLYEGPATREEARDVVERMKRRTGLRAEGDVIGLAMAPRAGGPMVGDCILAWTSEQHRQGEIGWIVHPDHQGRGYATEVGRVLLRMGFDGAGMHRIVGRLEARNAASARVLEKLGMRREAHLVENEYVKGEWQSEIVYAILEREWNASMRG